MQTKEETIFLEKRKKNVRGNNALTPLAENDRNYLRVLLEGFREIVEEDLIEGRIEHATNDFKYSPREMFEKIMRYFELSVENAQPLTICHMAMYCRMNKYYIYDICNGKKDYPKEYDFLKKAHDFVEAYNEYILHKKQNPAGPIFILKNFGWKDKFEIEAGPTQGALSEEEKEMMKKRIAQFSENK